MIAAISALHVRDFLYRKYTCAQGNCVHRDLCILSCRITHDRIGYNREWFERIGYNREWFDRIGYNREWFNRIGYNREWLDRIGYNRE